MANDLVYRSITVLSFSSSNSLRCSEYKLASFCFWSSLFWRCCSERAAWICWFCVSCIFSICFCSCKTRLCAWIKRLLSSSFVNCSPSNKTKNVKSCLKKLTWKKFFKNLQCDLLIPWIPSGISACISFKNWFRASFCSFVYDLRTFAWIIASESLNKNKNYYSIT